MIDNEFIERFKINYQTALQEILEGKRLEYHLADVNATIGELETKIYEAKKTGQPYGGFESLKNEVYYLKYEILERI